MYVIVNVDVQTLRRFTYVDLYIYVMPYNYNKLKNSILVTLHKRLLLSAILSYYTIILSI